MSSGEIKSSYRFKTNWIKQVLLRYPSDQGDWTETQETLRSLRDATSLNGNWITECDAQATIHERLTSAVDAPQN
ncbi:MAG: hypothetical protein CMI17_09130 [Opitutaceae bacterium]|nr:hypothetical protein [Opitutaceae bacterium]